MDSILNFIGNILVWIAIYAFFKKRKNNSSFWYEYGVAIKNIVAFIKDLLKSQRKQLSTSPPKKMRKYLYSIWLKI